MSKIVGKIIKGVKEYKFIKLDEEATMEAVLGERNLEEELFSAERIENELLVDHFDGAGTYVNSIGEKFKIGDGK